MIIIFVVLFFLSLTDFIYLNQKKIHQSIFLFSFGLTYFLFTIKYYYGGDIALYVPVYEGIENPKQFIQNGSKYQQSGYFETGYLFFCSLMKYLGLSFWMMTVVISSFYFYVIYKLFTYISDKKTFALLILVILEYNLIFATYRQCLSVSFFLLMIISCLNEKYIKAIFFLFLTSIMHKSGFYISLIAFFLMTLKRIEINGVFYWILSFLLLIIAFLPINDIILFISNILPFSQSSLSSLEHHLMFGRKLQVILLLYFILISSVAYFSEKYSKIKQMQWVVFFGFIVIVFLYQYFYLLVRIRSYFIPLIIVYAFTIFKREKKSLDTSFSIEKKTLLFRQVFVIVLYLFNLHSIRFRYIEQNSLKSGIYNSSTIFSRLNKTEKKIKQEQLHKAEMYWKNEFTSIGKGNRINEEK
ncbi:MAG: EpsG family protein [Paludibacteraceae bacterium]|nr:EpsG family protein [Paludibacteraceae bacterium]